MKKKVLIIGNTATEYALAKYFSKDYEVFVASGSELIKDFATCVDIRDTSVNELLEFALENAIDLTIPVSQEALKANIAEIFSNNGLEIFAPSQNAARLVFDKTLAKKTLYKLHIPTPRFGIFEKQNMVADYIKNLKQPYVIKTNAPQSAVILNQTMNPRAILDSLFAEKNQKVLIEDYIWGTPFVFYTITDGFKALPIGSSIIHKHSLEGEGGQLTTGMGASIPNYKLSLDDELYLLDKAVYPTLELLQKEGNPYLGILGINGILTTDGMIYVLGFESFMQDSDCYAILKTIDENIYDLMNSCIIGSFSDETNCIRLKEQYSVSVTLHSKNRENNSTIEGYDNLDTETDVVFYNNVTKNKYLEYLTSYGPNMILTSTAATLAGARKKVYEEVCELNFNGIFYRKDI